MKGVGKNKSQMFQNLPFEFKSFPLWKKLKDFGS
jgi:hypothetical protein